MTEMKILLILLIMVISGCTAPTGTVLPPTLAPAIELPTAAAAQSAAPTQTETATPTETLAPTATASPTETAPPTATATPAPVVLVGAGDIAACGETEQGDENTAAVINQIIAQNPNTLVFTSGDNVYEEGRAVEYRNCFDPSWGQFKDRIRPVPGNHDYMTEQGRYYYEYFGEAAGPAGLGYYAYEAGDWQMIGLNSNCNDIACGPNSQQSQWLRQQLEASDKECTILYWHHPRFSSGLAGGLGSVNTFWKTANEFGAEIVVNGHEHSYERFAPLGPEGAPAEDGVRLFTVGTGGAYLRGWGQEQPGSEFRYNNGHGVIRFNLFPDSYEWQFITTDGEIADSGSGKCQ